MRTWNGNRALILFAFFCLLDWISMLSSSERDVREISTYIWFLQYICIRRCTYVPTLPTKVCMCVCVFSCLVNVQRGQ